MPKKNAQRASLPFSFPTGNKCRADELVFRQGLAESREQAQRLIMAGKVFLAPAEADNPAGSAPVSPVPSVSSVPSVPLIQVDKPGRQFRPDTLFLLDGVERFVSRGAYKLLTAIEHFGLDVSGFVCLDAGASTGGFTDCLLQHGALRVYAVDVGHAQLHERLRGDPRVISREGVNLRSAEADFITEALDMVVADVSFISLTLVLPPCLRWLRPGGLVVGLIKPQFEVGPHQTVKGVVRDEGVRKEAVDKVLGFCETLGLSCRGVVPSAIKGPKGNQEYLACWRKAG